MTVHVMPEQYRMLSNMMMLISSTLEITVCFPPLSIHREAEIRRLAARYVLNLTPGPSLCTYTICTC